MKQTIVSTLCGAMALSATYLGTSFDAQACRCLPPEITRDYSNAEQVFKGLVIGKFEFFSARFFLVLPGKAYKGCATSNPWLWVSSSNSSASCGSNFKIAEEYLFFTSPDGRYPWSQGTSTCSGNRVADQLTRAEQAFLDSRQVCCDDSCTCTDGSTPVNCLVDPCTVAKPCKTNDLDRCEPNYCGGCNAEFFAKDGSLLCDGPSACRSDSDCEDSQYCSFDGVCVEDGSCRKDAECNLPGNAFDYDVRCTGYGVCSENKCEFECGNSNCINHEGYDFGPCDFEVGWVRVGEKCEFISSGCASLIPGSAGSPFPNKQSCEAACNFGPATFRCGDKKFCEIGKSYCSETIPGAAPEIGQEVRANYDCIPFDPRCLQAPSCKRCGEFDPMFKQFCVQGPDGGLTLSIPLP